MNKIDVYYKDKLVGTLAYKQYKYYFQYNDEWINNGFSISPLSLPLKKGIFESKNPEGLFGVFSDSLPDAWGRMLLDRYIMKHYRNEDVNMLFRLALVGNKGMGALEFRPIYEDNDYKFEINYDEIQHEADLALNGEDFDYEKLYKLSGSSGGARPKALVNIDGKSWIVKFQSKYDIKDCGVMEYDYAQACALIGINMPEVKLIEDKYFAIKRFDREANYKIHMLSFAGALEVDFNTPYLDYKDLFKLVKIITFNDMKDIKELYLRMCFNVIAHNQDDHLKNFAFIFDENINRYRLAPAYDMTYSNTSFFENTTTVNGKGKNITKEDLIRVGITAGIKEDECIRMYEKVVDVCTNKLNKYLK